MMYFFLFIYLFAITVIASFRLLASLTLRKFSRQHLSSANIIKSEVTLLRNIKYVIIKGCEINKYLFLMRLCTKALETNVIYNSAERCYLLINGALKMGGE